MITVIHSGRLGDIVYSLKACIKISERHDNEKIRYYVREVKNGKSDEVNYYEQCKDLIAIQPVIGEVLPFSNLTDETYHAMGIDYNLDNFRSINPWKNHVLLMHLRSMGLPEGDWMKPFLYVDVAQSPNGKPFVLVQRTWRYRNPRVNWKEIHNQLAERYGEEVYFVGVESEYKNHLSNVGRPLKWLKILNILDLARYFKGADSVYCNQSMFLPIAQGMGKEHYLELEPAHVKTVVVSNPEEHLMGV